MNPRNSHLASMPLILFLSLATSGWAQSSANSQPGNEASTYRGLGYFFAAPGKYSGSSDSVATLHIGGGGDVLVYKGVAVGAEIGGLAALEGSGGGMGLFSANASYYFSRQRRASPFFTGGYSTVFGHGQRNLVNLGGGLDYWVRQRIGIRLEFRDHVYADGSSRHLWGFRFGVVFR